MGHEVPGARLEDEPERVDRSADDARPLSIADVHAAAAPDGGRERGQVRHPVLGPEPAARVEVEEPLRAGGPLLELRRQRGEHLEPRGGELAAEAELGRRAGHAGGEERLRLVRGQAGEARPVAAREPVAARRPAHGLDGHARGGEGLDVAVHGADRHLEALRDVGRGQLAAGLEEEQERDETGRAHEFDDRGKHDRRCPLYLQCPAHEHLG